MRLIHCLDQGARTGPDHDCIVHHDRRLSYREVVERTWRVANGLRSLGLDGGHRAAVWSPNDLDAYCAWLGVLRSGVPLVPVNPRDTVEHNLDVCRRYGCDVMFLHASLRDELPHILRALPDLRAVVFLGDDVPEPALPWDTWLAAQPATVTDIPPNPEALVLLNLTSGTTGDPRAVGQTEAAMESFVATALASFRYDEPGVYLVAAPVTHAAGLLTYPHLALGATILLVDGPNPAEVLAAIERERVTTVFLPPTALHDLLDHPAVAETDTRSLRYLLVAGAPVSADRIRTAIDTFGPVVGQFYAMTEAPGVLCFLHPDDLVAADGTIREDRLGSCGRPTVFTEIAILDDDGGALPSGDIGEIAVRGTLVMRSYLEEPPADTPERRRGWHRTGDIGRIDDEGFVTILDRKKDMIITGGFNVFPAEVERVLHRHPAVEACVVVGAPDDRWGEAVTAVVQLRPGHQADEGTLRAFCRERLSGVKTPKKIEFEVALPRSPVGKIRRRDVRDPFWSDQDRSI